MANKALIIFNPKSGLSYATRYQNYFLKKYANYSPNDECVWLELKPRPLAEDLKPYLLSGFKKIIVIGGDGTIKSVVNYLIKNNLSVPLALIPRGSANSLASSLNIPLIKKFAIKTAATGKIKKIDVGLLNNQEYFLVGLSIGLISKIIIHTRRSFKKRFGILAYFFELLKNLKIKEKEFKFTLDNEDYAVKGNSLIVSNALSLFNLRAVHSLNIDDGLLEVIVSKNKTIFGFLAIIFFIFFNLKLNRVAFLKQGKKITIQSDSFKNQDMQMDGETIKPDKIEIEVLPQKLKIITQ